MTKVEALERLDAATFTIRGAVASADVVLAIQRIQYVAKRWESLPVFEAFLNEGEAIAANVKTLTKQNYNGKGMELRQKIADAKVVAANYCKSVAEAVEAYDGDKSPDKVSRPGAGGGPTGPRLLLVAGKSYKPEDLAKEFIETNHSCKLISEGRGAIRAYVNEVFPDLEDAKSIKNAVSRIAGAITAAVAFDPLNVAPATPEADTE